MLYGAETAVVLRGLDEGVQEHPRAFLGTRFLGRANAGKWNGRFEGRGHARRWSTAAWRWLAGDMMARQRGERSMHVHTDTQTPLQTDMTADSSCSYVDYVYAVGKDKEVAGCIQQPSD